MARALSMSQLHWLSSVELLRGRRQAGQPLGVLGLHAVQHVLQEAHQAVPRIRVGQGALRERAAPGVPATEQRRHELIRGEVAVHGGVAQPRPPGDLDQADAQPVVSEGLGGGSQDPVPILTRVAPAARPW